ncbi:YbaK/EbsC family protein [Streptomyces sp. SAI-127]|uniref:YbaK/EbsC family protein n=1 Tax=Streptomyces sp. SAI-127 TaxID=2940543 RepID=UPI0024731257|nr:YbaK/EbsC family protein [Streptomyces sp. SAI-127]MDH6486638.1 Ala-tRNA(Pro) deacylase [Streptomyces sp. SAI-127]
MSEVYHRLVDHLRNNGVPFQEIEHPPAASAEEYRRVVGSALHEQAKALLLRRHRRGGGKDLLIHVLPGDQRGDLDALAGPLEAKRLRMARGGELREATGCSFGELPSVGSVFGLPLSMDARLLAQKRIFFNAGVLDRSVILDPKDLEAVESPIVVTLPHAAPRP